MMTMTDKNRFLSLRNNKISKFVYHKDIDGNDFFEIEFNGKKKLFVNFAFMRIYNENELLLSSWEASIDKNNHAIFDGDKTDCLLLCEMPNTAKALEGQNVENITNSPLGDLLIELSNEIKIEVLINCFCKDEYYYKLEDEFGETEVAM